MAWGENVNFALEPSVALNPAWGQMATEMRGREYKKDVATARDQAERRYHTERQQHQAQPIEDELNALQDELATLQTQRTTLAQEAESTEAEPVEEIPQESPMFPGPVDNGTGGNRTPDLTGANQATPGESQGQTQRHFYQQEPAKPEVSSYGNPYGPGSSNEETPSANNGGVGGSRQPDLSGVNPNATPPAGYDQTVQYSPGAGPLANGRLPIQPLAQPQIPSIQVAPQLQLFPKKTGRGY